MLSRYFLIVILGLGLLPTAAGYVQAAPPGQNVTPPAPQSGSQANKELPAANSVKSYTPEEKLAYQKKTAQQLQEIQQKIEDLRVKSTKISTQKKHIFLRGLVDLQRRFMLAKQKLAALEAAPAQNWSSLKAEMDKSMAALIQAVNVLEAL